MSGECTSLQTHVSIAPIMCTDAVEPIMYTDAVEPIMCTDAVEPIMCTDAVEPIMCTDAVEPIMCTDAVAQHDSTSTLQAVLPKSSNVLLDLMISDEEIDEDDVQDISSFDNQSACSIPLLANYSSKQIQITTSRAQFCRSSINWR